ncbi:extracellular matrix-binding protein ebh [Staphylococcus aureus]|uniref:Extracellular matrix-binding protein ebh n=1 Tax=Staphylococcus aureus TaxID=1280 RepID=A0A380E3P9_STAAU|nr:extracellular matrix-binding protein ebh [Staphylococcus aureus]
MVKSQVQLRSTIMQFIMRKQQINAAKTEAQQVINNDRATPQQVNAALSKVQAAQTKINEAKALLQNKEDNSQLVNI